MSEIREEIMLLGKASEIKEEVMLWGNNVWVNYPERRLFGLRFD